GVGGRRGGNGGAGRDRRGTRGDAPRRGPPGRAGCFRQHRHGPVLARAARLVRPGLMDFAYPPEAAAFREEFRAWLATNLPEGLVGFDWASMVIESHELAQTRAWNRTLAEARYAAIAWPTDDEGRGARRAG